MSRYRHVPAMRAEGFPVEAAGRAAEVSISAFYDWKTREVAGPSEKELDATYGNPRMTRELPRRGFCVNHKRTERLMAEHGIVAVTPRRSARTTIRPARAGSSSRRRSTSDGGASRAGR